MRPRLRLRSDHRILLLALASGLPAMVVALVFLWRAAIPVPAVGVVGAALVGAWLGLAGAATSRYRRPFETLANILAAIRVGDYSTRIRGADPGDPTGLAFHELNRIAARLRGDRLGGLEAGALLRAVLAEIEVAIVAVDDENRVQFANRSTEALVERPLDEIEGATAAELGISDLLTLDTPATVERTVAGTPGRYDVRLGSFRQEGRPHRLLVVSDVSRALREEERAAWRRLVRVLSHEINNSLAPIRSISGSLLDLLRREPPPEDRDADLTSGLSVIASRADALSRFMTAYIRWARLPPPQKRQVDVKQWVQRVVRLEPRLPVAVLGGPRVTVEADPDQLDQLLINLVRNAVEASAETGGGVTVDWDITRSSLKLRVRDEGLGLASTENLFVPFFTTKPGGSGIGLVLSRDVADAHGGSLALANRSDGPGCEAVLTLPLN